MYTVWRGVLNLVPYGDTHGLTVPYYGDVGHRLQSVTPFCARYPRAGTAVQLCHIIENKNSIGRFAPNLLKSCSRPKVVLHYRGIRSKSSNPLPPSQTSNKQWKIPEAHILHFVFNVQMLVFRRFLLSPELYILWYTGARTLLIPNLHTSCSHSLLATRANF